MEYPDQDSAIHLFQRILSHGIKVKSINIDGLKSVKEDVVLPHVKPLLEPKTLASLMQHVGEAQEELSELGAFRDVSVQINHLPGSGTSDVREVSLNISVVEEESKRQYGMNVSSDMNSTDGNFHLFGRYRNMFGRLESLTLNYTKGTTVSDGYNLIFNKPILCSRNSSIKSLLSKETAIHRMAGYVTSNYKSSLLYQFPMLGGLNLVQAGCLWQQISGSNAPIKIREEFGHHMKCSVQHMYTRDTRDDNATSGTLFSVNTELAGFIGDVHHLKVDTNTQINIPLILGFVGTLSLRGGFIKTMDESTRTRITDRFFCGGPGSVRGFYADGIGPQTASRPLGGLLHWGAGFSLTHNLPFNPYIWGLGRFMRLHSFVNTGSLVTDRNDAFKFPRLSVGSGLIVSLPNNIKLEVNYAVPIRFERNDVVNHGLQFGIGINFL